MDITEEKIDAQNALLKIKLQPEDYREQYDKALKKYRQQITMPGFRVGKVPMGIVKKRYGKPLLAEELNKVLSNNIQSYISEKDLKVLGSPLPSDAHGERGDWDNPSEFEFVYELGLAPDLNIEITKKDQFGYYTIAVSDKMVDEQVKNLRSRYGSMKTADSVKNDSILTGDFIELDENGDIKPAGVFHSNTFLLTNTDENEKENFIGKKVGEDVIFNIEKLGKNHGELAKMLEISHEQVHAINSQFKFVIHEVKQIEQATLNQEFYDKVLGEDKVKSEDEFRDFLKNDLSAGYKTESDHLFKRDIIKYLVAKYSPALPDAFLKKWIMMTNEEPLTLEQIEVDYEEYKKGMQWQLIFNQLMKEDAMKVSEGEVLEDVKSMLAEQFRRYGLPTLEDKELLDQAKRVLSNKDELKKVYDKLYDSKLTNYIREKATVTEKEVDFDTFVKMAQAY